MHKKMDQFPYAYDYAPKHLYSRLKYHSFYILTYYYIYYLYILYALYRKIHQKLDKILMQQSNSRRHVPEKPAILPISSVTNVEEFETVNDEEYMKLVCKT